jgi:Spy/CpxP family protein refolding chaperone
MKKQIFMLAAALLLPLSIAFADPAEGGYQGRHGHNLDHLSKELSLTAEQKASLETIFKEEHEKFRALHEESHTRIKAVLNGEQITKWEQIISQHKSRHSKHQKPE